jgi:SAM-dependent methyltransferase
MNGSAPSGDPGGALLLSKTPSVAEARDAAPHCPVCSSAKAAPFIRHDGLDLFRCGDCASVYVFPPPGEAVTHALYVDAYQGATAGYFAKVEKKMRRSRGRIAQLRRFVEGGRFLDVGCNGGFVVEAAREAGFEAHGLDLDPVSIAYAKEHYPRNDFFCGPVQSLQQPAESFDLVYSSEVIEHVPEPHGFISAIVRLMKPGAYFYVTTPDISHWRVPKDVTTWDGFCPPSHCVFFTPRSLAAALEKHGLAIVKRAWAFKPGIKLLARKR